MEAAAIVAAGRHENGGTHLHHAAAEQQAVAQQARMNSGFKSLLTDLGTVDFSCMIHCFLMFVRPRVRDLLAIFSTYMKVQTKIARS